MSVEKFINGEVLLIDKPIGWTSFNVVKKIKYLIQKKYNIKKLKVGHAGTLDPLATGLLIICTGKATKKIIDFQNMSKVYTGEITLGATTDSYDLETEITKTYETKHLTASVLEKTTKKFIGEINQVPPIFSAIKLNGERLYKKARRGESVKIKSRKIKIFDFTLTNIDMPKVNFKINCSKGTYIRSIANDFGKELNSGGYLSRLCRESIGNYHLSESLDINSFKNSLNC
jgi:tRNA pseudouridine55 synthase